MAKFDSVFNYKNQKDMSNYNSGKRGSVGMGSPTAALAILTNNPL